MKLPKNKFIDVKSLFCLLFLSTCFYTCDIKDNEIEPEQHFLKIYDDQNFNASYIPLDIQQTSDEGFLILSGTRIQESNFIGIRLLKLDKAGEFVKEISLEPNFVHPTYNLMKTEEGYFFFCMDATSLQAHLVQINEEGGLENTTPVGGISYPLHASYSGSNFILQSYNNNDKQTVLSLVNSSGNVSKSQQFGIGAGEDVEKPVMEHFTRTGRQLPFLTGQTNNGTYYFNGFFNYTFSLVFSNLNSNEPSGISQGQQDDGGISAIIPTEGSSYAISRFNFGDNYFTPKATINAQGISSSTDIVGFSMPELVADAKVILKKVVVNGANIILYGSNTKNGQILLLAYDEASGALKGTKYLGYSYPYEIAGFVQTADEGLAVAALTQVAGRFPRICLFKLSKEELSDIMD